MVLKSVFYYLSSSLHFELSLNGIDFGSTKMFYVRPLACFFRMNLGYLRYKDWTDSLLTVHDSEIEMSEVDLAIHHTDAIADDE